MISSEVQRTLVKSPPELWAELSDPSSLARHLEALGEIKITKLRPERSVEWEAEAARGKVELKPSGWGTKVMLTVTRELAADEVALADPPADRGGQAIPPEGEQADEQPVQSTLAEGEQADGPPGVEALPPTSTQGSRSRWASLMRVFSARGRRKAAKDEGAPRSAAPDGEGPAETTAEDQEGAILSAPAIAGEPPTSAAPAPGEEPPTSAAPAPGEEPPTSAAPAPGEEPPTVPERAGPSAASSAISAELRGLEEEIATQTTEILTAVLDRLGAAHHRPFSRP